MNRHVLGKTGYSISPVVFGGIINTNETQADADRFVAGAVDHGINYFDVAPSYGDAEARLGPALAPYRKDVYLACKTVERSAEGSKRELLASLERLRTDHFDVYQMHSVSKPEDIARAFGPGGAMETLVWAKREGYVRAVGFSAHSEDIALEALKLFDFDTVLFPMNWALGVLHGWGDRIAVAAKEKNFGLLAMKTLIQRMWHPGEERTYPKSWCKPISGNDALGIAAMKYGLYKGAATLVPPGNHEHFTFMLDHIDECLAHPLGEGDLALLRAEAEKVRGHELSFG